jgi:hypothetical protein
MAGVTEYLDAVLAGIAGARHDHRDPVIQPRLRDVEPLRGGLT